MIFKDFPVLGKGVLAWLSSLLVPALEECPTPASHGAHGNSHQCLSSHIAEYFCSKQKRKSRQQLKISGMAYFSSVPKFLCKDSGKDWVFFLTKSSQKRSTTQRFKWGFVSPPQSHQQHLPSEETDVCKIETCGPGVPPCSPLGFVLIIPDKNC